MNFPETCLCAPINALLSFAGPELPAIDHLFLARSRHKVLMTISF